MTYVLASVALTVLLMLASASDIRARRVPNPLNAVVLSGGLLFQLVSPRPGDGWSSALAGLAVGFAIWFPMYLFRLVGAGDVKLFAAAAVWVGPRDAVVAAMVTACAGAVLGAGWMLRRRGLAATSTALTQLFRAPSLLQLPPLERLETVPYALPVSVGILTLWFWPILSTLRAT
jgi:prepilin peptidase CpaA